MGRLGSQMRYSRIRYPSRRERRLAMHTSTIAKILRYVYEYKIPILVPNSRLWALKRGKC